MKISARILVTLALLAAAMPSARAGTTLFLVNISGSSRISKLVGMDNKLTSTPVSSASLCAAMSVDPKKYAIVYDADSSVLELIPKSAGAMLPTKPIFQGDSIIKTYQATKPRALLTYRKVVSAAGTAGTPFDTLNGTMTVLTKAVLANSMLSYTGVIGSVTAAATGTAESPLYTIAFTGAKPFVQKP